MYIRSAPDPIQKLAQVGDANRFEPVGDRPQCERTAPLQRRREIPVEVAGVMSCITEVTTPRGKKPVLKAMVTTACENDCLYCPFRAGRTKMHRVTFKPDEMARAFNLIQQAGLVDGIFLSSGIVRGGVTTQDSIIDTIEIIRKKYAYTGYVHLKIMPGAEYDQLRRAMQLADRVSINLEGPTPERLARLAPGKEFEADLLERLRWAHAVRRQAQDEAPGFKQASLVTQFVVGAVGDTDLELLSISERLYRRLGLQRAYYSAFNPIEETPFADIAPTSPTREHRLYQASFLLRDYDWDVEDLPFVGEGNLRLDVDPKRAWADDHLRHSPVEVMRADRRELMRVPGIGPKGAQAIINARRRGRLADLGHLRTIGIRGPQRAAPYILLDGRRPPHQLSFLDDLP